MEYVYISMSFGAMGGMFLCIFCSVGEWKWERDGMKEGLILRR